MKKIVIASLITCTLLVQGAELSPLSGQQALELTRERIVQVLRSIIKKHPKATLGGYVLAVKVALFEWLPGYIIKLNTDRIDCANNVMAPCIQEEGLTLLRLPKMWYCPVPEPHNLPDYLRIACIPKQLCLTEYIEGRHEGHMTLEQTKQMVTFISKAKRAFVDCQSKNIIFTNDGQLALIDTESRGFEDSSNESIKKALLCLYRNNKFEAEAKEYLRNEINQKFDAGLKAD